MAGRSCSLANARLEPPREVGHLHRGVRGLVAFSTNCVIARPPGSERLVVLTRALPYSPIHSPTGLNERGGRRETAWLMELARLEPATSWVRSTRSSERETLCLRHFSKERLEGRNISHNISAPDSASAGSTPDWFGMPTNTGALLEAYTLTGVLGLARRDGNRRYSDLLERLLPAKLLDCCPRSSTG